MFCPSLLTNGNEVIYSTCEYHLNKTAGVQKPAIAVGDVVIVKDDKVKKCFWKLALVKHLLPDNDGHVQAAVIKVSEFTPNQVSCTQEKY